MKNENKFEVIIIGGSYAGLSAAMALGRSLRNTLIIDEGKPCNRQTPHSHNFLTQDGSTPHEIATIAKKQLNKYKHIKFYNGIAISAKKVNESFEVIASNGDIFMAKKLILATGINDKFPNIDGFAACWGISVVHCPYCHGYEIRHQKTAIITNGERGFHLASMVNNLTKNITILTSGANNFDERQLKKLKHHQIKIIEKEIATIAHKNGQLEKIIFKDGSSETFECAYAAIPFEQNTSIVKELGLKLTETGHIETNFMQETSVDGVYACGDNASPMRSVANAVAAGNLAGAATNGTLTKETF